MILLKNHHKDSIPIYIFIAAVAVFVVLAFTSCYNQKKAQSQFSRAAIAYPKLPADYCAITYPPHTVTDSTEYKNSKRIIDSLAQVLQSDSLLSDVERQRLTEGIERVRGLIVEPKNCDSLSNAILKLASKEKQRGDKLQAAYNNLITATQNLRPVHDTTENTAKIKACEIDKSILTGLLKDKTDEAAKYKHKAMVRGITMWALIFLIIGAGGMWIYFKAKKLPTKVIN